jgi:hypothetical protein
MKDEQQLDKYNILYSQAVYVPILEAEDHREFEGAGHG